MATTAEIGKLRAELVLKNKKFEAGIKKSTRSTRSFQSSLKKMGTALVVAFGAAAVAAIGLVTKKLIEAARNAEETENLFRESFRDMSEEARAWSIETSRALGLNQFELRENSALIFNMVRSMGLGKEAAFEMATGMTQLANDMASFFNLRPEDAFAKLRSGITGEAEPLKRLGVLVDEATIKQIAYNKGLVVTGSTLTQVQKVQARWLAILDQTQTAQGDLGRTLGSTSNQMRSISARVEELSVTMGQNLIPVFDRILTVVSGVVNELQGFFDALKDIDEISRRLAKSTLETRFSRISEEVDSLRIKAERLQNLLDKNAQLLFGNTDAVKEELRLTKELIKTRVKVLDQLIKARNRNLKLGLLDAKPKDTFRQITGPQAPVVDTSIKRAMDQQVKDFLAHQEKIANIQSEIIKSSTTSAQKEFDLFNKALAGFRHTREISLGDTLERSIFGTQEEESLRAAKAIELGLVDVEQQFGKVNEKALKMSEILKFFKDPLDDLAKLSVAIEDVGKQMGLTTLEIQDAVERAEESFGVITEEFTDFEKQVLSGIEAIRSGFESRLTDAIDGLLEKTGDFKEGMLDALRAIRRELVRTLLVQPFIKGVGGFFGIPGFAHGGNIKANQLSVVGEAGPELFVPSVSGSIVPNDKISGGGNTIYIDARNSMGEKDLERKMRRTIAEATPFLTNVTVKTDREEKRHNPHLR